MCSFDDQFIEFFVYLEIRPLSDVGLVKIFACSVGHRFFLLTRSLSLQKLFSFRRSHLLIISIVSVLLELYLGSGLLCQCIQVYFLLSLL